MLRLEPWSNGFCGSTATHPISRESATKTVLEWLNFGYINVGRAKEVAMSIYGLLNQIKSGDIVLPAIQRDFVWSEEKVTRLLDSVMRGYPIGITLLWETYDDVQYRHFVENYEGNGR